MRILGVYSLDSQYKATIGSVATLRSWSYFCFVAGVERIASFSPVASACRQEKKINADRCALALLAGSHFLFSLSGNTADSTSLYFPCFFGVLLYRIVRRERAGGCNVP